VQLLADGLRAMQAGRHAQAISEHFDKVIDFYQAKYKDVSSRVYCARSLHESLQYTADAARDKVSAIVLKSTWADAHFAKGFALVELKRNAEAKPSLEQAVRMSPRNAHYLSELANLYTTERNWPLALATFRAAEAAAKDFEPSPTKDSEVARAWRGQGFVLVEMNHYDEAEALYLRCLQLDRSDQQAAAELLYVREQRAASAH
jgi:tetratricopeptide (TPR) repeat protein